MEKELFGYHARWDSVDKFKVEIALNTIPTSILLEAVGDDMPYEAQLALFQLPVETYQNVFEELASYTEHTEILELIFHRFKHHESIVEKMVRNEKCSDALLLRICGVFTSWEPSSVSWIIDEILEIGGPPNRYGRNNRNVSTKVYKKLFSYYDTRSTLLSKDDQEYFGKICTILSQRKVLRVE